MGSLIAWLGGIDMGTWLLWANFIGGLILLGVVVLLVLLVRAIGGKG